MDSRGENRVKLTKEMVPTRLCDDIAKAHTKKLVYKFRFEHIDNWGRLMGHYTAENLRDLAASKCIPRGMTLPYQAIQRHLNEADEKHLSVSRIFRTLGIGMQFDIKMMVQGFICPVLLKYPWETLMEMAKEGKPRFLLLFLCLVVGAGGRHSMPTTTRRRDKEAVAVKKRRRHYLIVGFFAQMGIIWL